MTLVLLAWAGTAAAEAPVPPLTARIQMHRGGTVAYVPLPAQPGTDPALLTVTPLHLIPLDGGRAVNVQGNVLPIDVDGDGQYEFVHWNGYRILRVYRQDGTKLWQKDNPTGRVQPDAYHRDSAIALDVDGDGRQELIHCWVRPGDTARHLFVRDGTTGATRYTIQLPDSSITEECQVAAFYMTGRTTPVILVARQAPAGTICHQNYADVWSRVTAYDTHLIQLWDHTNCDAGHYVHPLDLDGDGYAEGVFVGKYLYDARGTLLCKLSGWGDDHVDGLQMLDGEAIAVGRTGTRAYSVTAGCPLRWSIPTTTIYNPQHVSIANGQIFIVPKSAPPGGVRQSYRLSPAGQLEAVLPLQLEYQNANLDGAGSEDRLGAWGHVADANGNPRFDINADWLGGLQMLPPEEATLPMQDRWSLGAFAFDLDHDGRDELIEWGRNVLLIAHEIPVP